MPNVRSCGSRRTAPAMIGLAARIASHVAIAASSDRASSGRVAMGEVFAFEHALCRTRLRVNGELLAVENCRLSPNDGSLHSLRVHHAHSYHATWFAVFPNDIPDVPKTVGNIETAIVGASALNSRAYVGKILAADGPAMRRAVASVREICYAFAAKPLPNWRKL